MTHPLVCLSECVHKILALSLQACITGACYNSTTDAWMTLDPEWSHRGFINLTIVVKISSIPTRGLLNVTCNIVMRINNKIVGTMAQLCCAPVFTEIDPVLVAIMHCIPLWCKCMKEKDLRRVVYNAMEVLCSCYFCPHNCSCYCRSVKIESLCL